ncbi:prostatic acid phosphatase-like isoform X1 [Macrosteles quadrilineatus]|uniref:prostatic acid phosphatase-like isoform X1 n=2 Tax=Macrosteles quadrilineatus TaxID=74068 RepID=UPI0023E1266A|nr:prostatic acid phosphatase-like isoform X1 [Macrosteles quadrilineatus]
MNSSRSTRSFLLQHAKPSRINTFTTVVVLGGIIIAFLFAYAAFGKDPEGRTTLSHVSIIFRHGEKNPTSSYANDPYKESLFWPEGWGQLTNRGKRQMYQVGEWLRRRYGNALPRYSPQTVRVDSSDHDRCHQSAAVLLAALFPPSADQVWNDQLLWQPIPIHSSPLSMDKLITVKAKCPLYDREKHKSDSELSAKYDKQNSELYKYLTDKAGQNISSLLDVESLFNILEIEKETGKQLPEWTESVYPDKMKDIAALVLASFTHTPLMKRIKGGPLIGAVAGNMNAVFNGTSKRKVSLYAAHDLTIVSVRRALGFNDIAFKPGLGAALIVELEVVNNVPLVEVHYAQSYADTDLERWELPGCPSPCSLSAFTEAMSSVIPQDWDSECNLDQASS